MKKAEVINGYTLLSPLSTKNAGCCMWTYAERGGERFFIKQLIDPVFPDETVISNPKVLERKKQACDKFERRMSLLCRRMNEASDGNLIRVEQFFRKGTKYYITMRQVLDASSDETLISKQPIQERILACMTLAHSLLGLHRCGIVHGDIKPNNVLLCRSETGKYITKLIDLDTCKFEYELKNEKENLMGDQTYLAPEICKRMFGDAAEVTCKVDVFSMGLLFHQYLTGDLPKFDQTKYHYAHAAVLNGELLVLSPDLNHSCRTLLMQMLVCEPDQRCSMEEVYCSLKKMLMPPAENDSKGNRPVARSLHQKQQRKGQLGWYVPDDMDL